MKTQNQELEDEVLEFKRSKLRDLLNQCTDKQQAFFMVVFKPKDNAVENVESKYIDSAINLCKRTIASNKLTV